MKKHPLQEKYERSFGKINESISKNQIKYNIQTILNQVNKINQTVQTNPEFEDDVKFKTGLNSILVAINQFLQANK